MEKRTRGTPRQALIDWLSRRKERPGNAKGWSAAFWDDRTRAAAQLAPCAALLLLAPLIKDPKLFYFLVMVTAVPLTLWALSLQPLGSRAWQLRTLIPLLPVEAWFALRCGLWHPGFVLGMVGAFALAGLLCYMAAQRGGSRSKEKALRWEEENAGAALPAPKLEVQDRRQARRVRGNGERTRNKATRRRLLVYVTRLAAISLAVPALLGIGLELQPPRPNAVTELEEKSLRDDALMARRMNGVYEQLQPGEWGRKSRREKIEALQALLDLETDSLEIGRFDLRDPAVYGAAHGTGHTGVSAALHSGKGRAEQRVRAICHLAYHLMQLSVSKNVTLHRFEEMAKGYEDDRYKLYAGLWDKREAENDHVQ